MIKVECVSCKSPYDVDERRIPDKGMKMRCPKCSTSFMVARDGTVSAAPAAAARPPLAPVVPGAPKVAQPPSAASARPDPKEKDFTEGPATEPISPQIAAASLLNPAAPILQPKAAAQPKLGDAPSAFNKTLVGGGMPNAAAPKAAPLGNILGLGNATKANDAVSIPPKLSVKPTESATDLPAVKPPARPAVPWGSLAPPSMDSKPARPAAGPVPGAALPKGAIGGAGPQPSASGPSLKSSAGSAFGAKQTLLGPARANAPTIGTAAVDNKLQPTAADPAELELTDLPARAGALPLIDLPAAKPATDNGAFGAKKPAASAKKPLAPDLPLVDLPAAKAASPLGQPNMQRPANSIAPEDLDLDALVDLPAPRPQPAGPAFGAKRPAAAAEPPIVDLPAPTGIDLPSPKANRTAMGGFAAPPKKSAELPRAAAPEPDLGIDLPAPKPQAPARKAPPPPAARLAAPPRPESFDIDATLEGLSEAPGELDLPAPKGEVDLPAPKGARSRGYADEIDLPAPKGITDLPAVLGGLDLPTAKGFGDVDLPTPKGVMPAALGGIDLPTPKGVVDLPTPVGASDLPTPKGFTDLPVNKSDDGFGMLDLPVPKSQDEASFGDLELPDLPVRAGFGDAELPMPHAKPERAHSSIDEASFGDLDLGGPEMAEESFADVRSDDLVRVKHGEPAPTSTPPALQGHGEAEAEAYGEAGLADESTEEDMEFGIAGGDENLGLPPELLRRNKGEAAQADDAARGKRALKVLIGVAAALALLGGGGAALGLTDYGFFGVYYWEQFLPEAADARFAHEAIARAEKTASTDTYRDVQRALALLGESRHKAGLNRELLTRSLLHESLFAVRFGTHASSAAHAAAIMARLEERHGRAPGMALGRAADAARRGDFAEAQRTLEGARAESGDDAYFALLEGEIALHDNKLAEADKAFVRALKQGGAARAQWGVARVALSRTDVAQQKAAVTEMLKLSPEHVEARLALARLLWNEGKQSEATSELDRALGREKVGDRFLWASKAASAGSYSMLGFVNESRGHLSQARKAYDEALAADPYMIEALLGSGRVLLRERRWNDALARFESALNLAQKSNGGLVLSGRRADVEARLGQSHAQLSLNRAPEAKATLAELMKVNPNDAEIVRAAGQAEDVVGNQSGAEELLSKSIELAPTTFAGYLSLAQHYFKLGRADKASETLNDAASKVEENVEMRRMLGQSELVRGRFDSAVHEFKRATEIDPDNLDAQFGLASAYRRTNELDKARALLDAIAKRDVQFAGLALERGLLLEAQGKFDEAVKAYRAAHLKDPGDTALNLRLGAAQVEAGQLDDAEMTLQSVMREMPNSAEAEYFSGRLALARGRGPDALTHFDRALSLDGTQALYHLYAARAALDMGNLGRTLDEAEATLSRDASVGDAFWVRGIVRLRSGAVRDALKDAKRALDLNPLRHDAYALMAECYDELRQLGPAAQSFRIALTKDPQRGEWWYKFGRLSMDRGAKADANEALEQARRIGDKMDPMPYWLPDAYRLSGEQARASGDRKQAVALFRRYLAIAPDGALDREDVRKLLMSWEVEL
jgi:cellulose synthase operon protein C